MKLSQPVSDAADAMRGTELRAHWLESLIKAALQGAPVTEAAMVRPEPPRTSAEVPEPAPGPVEAVRVAAAAAGVPLVPASELPPACSHRIARGVYCKICRVKKA